MKLLLQISIIILLYGCGQSREADEKFDSAKWKTDEQSRYRMVNDLIEKDLLLEKSKEEVINLLGNPNENGPCDNCFGYPTYEPDQFSIDHEVLQINFNNQNRVSKVFKNAW